MPDTPGKRQRQEVKANDVRPKTSDGRPAMRKDDPTRGWRHPLLDENGFPVYDEHGYPV